MVSGSGGSPQRKKDIFCGLVNAPKMSEPRNTVLLFSFVMSLISTVIIFFYLLGFELRALSIARQVLYHSSHAPSPFCFGLFFR
jgi:hypothetical protein